MVRFGFFNSQKKLKIGQWEVEPELGIVANGATANTLAPKPMEVLMCLAHAKGGLVQASQLKSEVWQDTHVVDDVVKRCISQIRKAFGDTAELQTVIRTIPKRGYAIACEIEWIDEKWNSIKRRLTGLSVLAICIGVSLALLLSDLPNQFGQPTVGSSSDLEYQRAQAFYDGYEFEDNESAIAIFRRIIGRHPNHAQAYAGLSNALLQRNIRWSDSNEVLDEAKQAALTAIDLDPNLPEGYKALGLYYQTTNKFSEAAKSYRTAIRLNPRFWAATNNLGEVYRELGDYDAAEKFFKRSLDISPDNEQSLTALGELQFRRGQYLTSRNYFDRALAVSPYSEDALIGQSLIALYTGDLESAINHCNRLLKVWPNAHDCTRNIGIATLLQGETERASVYFEILQRNPSPYWKVEGNIRQYQIAMLSEDPDGNPLFEKRKILQHLDDALSNNDISSARAFWLKALLASINNDTGHAITVLGKAIKEGHRDFHWDVVEPGFANLRHNKRFLELLDDRQVDAGID